MSCRVPITLMTLFVVTVQASIFSQMSLASKTKTQFDEAVRLDPNYLDARRALMEYYMMAPALIGGSEAKAIDEANEIKKRDPQRGNYAL